MAKVYENAEKLFPLGNRPIGVAIYGLAALGSRSISSYLNEFEQTDPSDVLGSSRRWCRWFVSERLTEKEMAVRHWLFVGTLTRSVVRVGRRPLVEAEARKWSSARLRARPKGADRR